VGVGTLLLSTVVLGIAGLSSWAVGADCPAILPQGDFGPRRTEIWLYSGADAAARRTHTLRRAVFRLDATEAAALDAAVPGDEWLRSPVPSCRFLPEPPSGTSAKFDCVVDGGDVVKVKYGRSPEIHAEAAATRLMRLLGYPADTITIVPRLRCYGCPRLPFLAMRLQDTFKLPLLPPGGHDDGYTDFEWVSVERKFPARPIETVDEEGWAWWELARSNAPRAEVDAMRLTAVFLAHWDNKAGNQRLVCLDDTLATSDGAGEDDGQGDGEATAAAPGDCERPLAMIQDLGATFGPSKVNLARWNDLPVWRDRDTCGVSMRTLPFDGATFGDATISEAGRALLAERLAAISDAEVERIFAEARFPQFQAGTADDRDLKAWTAAFRRRADQIVNVRCGSAATAESNGLAEAAVSR
jgi:hypothetical protein